MDVEKIRETIDKIPLTFLLIAYLGYLGFGYYTFENDESSPKSVILREIKVNKELNAKYQKKYEELNEFAKTLEQKKVLLRELAGKLQDAKVSLSENVDVPGFMKMVTTEAKKLNLNVLTLKPSGIEPEKFYGKVKFVLGFQGVFMQLMSFMQRLANLTRIIHINSLKTTVSGSNLSKFVLLKGEIELVVFKYIGSTEDQLGIEDVHITSAQTNAGQSITGSTGVSGVGLKVRVPVTTPEVRPAPLNSNGSGNGGQL